MNMNYSMFSNVNDNRKIVSYVNLYEIKFYIPKCFSCMLFYFVSKFPNFRLDMNFRFI